MRYERIESLVRLAVRLQGTPGGLTLDDIQADFSVSRSTAERMRNAVGAVFGPLDLVDTDDAKRRWRLRSDAVRRLVAIAAEELAELESAASALERVGLEERAGTLRDFAIRVRATLRTESLALLEAELEALMQAEGLAMRSGPRPRLDAGLLSALREAITTCRLVKFRYLAKSTGLQSYQRVKPLGLLYGNRAFLVASSDWGEEPRLWRLAKVSELRISEETFERDPDFDLERYAKRSFGTFQEEPVEVVLRFAPTAARDASNFTFHPDQTTEPNDDGSRTVQFEAGGIDEMCWHLFTWGKSVTIEKPLHLRQRLAEMCKLLAAHHDTAQCTAMPVQERHTMEIVTMLQQEPEPLPNWLREPPRRFNRESFFSGRTVYYPSFGNDGHPVSLCARAHAAHAFVYVDYGVSKETVSERVHGIGDPGFIGYSVEHEEEVSESDLRPGGWTQHVEQREFRTLSPT